MNPLRLFTPAPPKGEVSRRDGEGSVIRLIQCLRNEIVSNRNEEKETNAVISTEGEPEANRSGEI